MEISKEKILENINSDIPFDLNGENKEFYLEFDKFVDLICDVSINSVAPLSEKETYVLRKRLGVFDNGNIQSLRVVGESLDEVRSVERIRQILKKNYRKIPAYINKKIGDSKTRQYVEQLDLGNPNDQILDADIVEFNLTVRSYNILKRSGIGTLRDLISLNKDKLRKLRNMGDKSFNEIINFVHDNGLLFADEVSTIKYYGSEIHKQLQNQTDNELLQKYHSLVSERAQLEARSQELDLEISSVMEQLQSKNKEVQNGQSRKQ